MTPAAFFESVTTNKGLTMMITGQQLINGQWVQGEAGQYQAVNPAAAAFIEPVMSYASKAQVHQAVAAAAAGRSMIALLMPDAKASSLVAALFFNSLMRDFILVYSFKFSW